MRLLRFLLAICFVMIAGNAISQSYTNQPSYGYKFLRIQVDSALNAPVVDSISRLKPGTNLTIPGGLKYCKQDSSFYVYTGYQFIKIGSGSGSIPNLDQVLQQGHISNRNATLGSLTTKDINYSGLLNINSATQFDSFEVRLLPPPYTSTMLHFSYNGLAGGELWHIGNTNDQILGNEYWIKADLDDSKIVYHNDAGYHQFEGAINALNGVLTQVQPPISDSGNTLVPSGWVKELLATHTSSSINFANTDLTLTGDRTHDGAGHSLNIQNTSSLGLGSNTSIILDAPGLVALGDISGAGLNYGININPTAHEIGLFGETYIRNTASTNTESIHFKTQLNSDSSDKGVTTALLHSFVKTSINAIPTPSIPTLSQVLTAGNNASTQTAQIHGIITDTISGTGGGYLSITSAIPTFYGSPVLSMDLSNDDSTLRLATTGLVQRLRKGLLDSIHIVQRNDTVPSLDAVIAKDQWTINKAMYFSDVPRYDPSESYETRISGTGIQNYSIFSPGDGRLTFDYGLAQDGEDTGYPSWHINNFDGTPVMGASIRDSAFLGGYLKPITGTNLLLIPNKIRRDTIATLGDIETKIPTLQQVLTAGNTANSHIQIPGYSLYCNSILTGTTGSSGVLFGNGATFTGRLYSNLLSNARSWRLPDTSGTVIVDSTLNNILSNYMYTNNGIVTSATTLNIGLGKFYIFTGTVAVWTLPATGHGISNGSNYYIMKNRGSGTITVNSASGGTDIYDTSPVATWSILPGETLKLFNDGTYFDVVE